MFFLLGTSRRCRTSVHQPTLWSINPPSSPAQIMEQTPNVGKLREILGNRPSVVIFLDLAPHPSTSAMDGKHPTIDVPSHSSSTTEAKANNSQTKSKGGKESLPYMNEETQNDLTGQLEKEILPKSAWRSKIHSTVQPTARDPSTSPYPKRTKRHLQASPPGKT